MLLDKLSAHLETSKCAACFHPIAPAAFATTFNGQALLIRVIHVRNPILFRNGSYSYISYHIQVGSVFLVGYAETESKCT